MRPSLLYHPTKNATLDITHLKTSLSQALTSFYPLAGKVTQSTVNCNDDGVPFIEAKANCSLSTFLNLPAKLDYLSNFLPPLSSLGLGDAAVSELTHLAIQTTLFSCGGVSIGWYDIHKILDGISGALFLKHWATLSNQTRENGLVQPDFNSLISVFPPTSKQLQLPIVDASKKELEHSQIMTKSFIFRNSTINELKAKAVSSKVPNPTSFLAIAGFIWKQALFFSKTDESDSTSTGSIQVTLDIRPRVDPPLPRESIGNLALIAVAHTRNRPDELHELVAEINSAISDVNDEMKQCKGEDGIETVMTNWSKVIKTSAEYKDRAYRLTSWCRLGFGRPIRMIPTDGRMSEFHRNMIILNDYKGEDGDHGIEAWLFLEEKEMEALESNQEFLAFAFPSH